MKMSIFALLSLLLILIVTCVYEKTYTLYSTSSKELTLVERAPIVQVNQKSVIVEKKEEQIPVQPPKTLKLEETKPTTKAQPISIPESKTKPAEQKKPVVQSAKETTKLATEIQEPQMIVTAKSIVAAKQGKPTPRQSTEKMKVTSVPKLPTVLKNHTQVTPAPQIHNSEKEIVDYIMWALNNRALALKNREAVEARIQDLITQALNDRKVVLEERSSNEVELMKHQAELIDARDAAYESVTNPKTKKEGEK